MARFMHLADTHLRASQYYKTSRGDDFFQSLMFCLRLAVDEGLDFILHSGDLLDSTRPVARTLQQLAEADRVLKEAGIPMYTILGNHDLTDPPWIDVFKNQDVGGIKHVGGSRLDLNGITVNAVPFMSRAGFLEHEAGLEPATILMWHGQVQEFSGVPLGDEALSVEDLPRDKYRLILLGDIHVHQQIKIQGKEMETIVTMPGSAELCRENEEADKFVDIYELDEEVSLRSVPIPTRPVYRYKVRTEEELEQVLSELKKAAAEAEDKDSYILAFVQYDPSLTGVTGRLHAHVDPQTHILRARHLPVSGEQMPETGHMDQDVAPVDFLPEFLHESEPTFALGETMLRPDLTQEEARDNLERFISQEMGDGSSIKVR